MLRVLQQSTAVFAVVCSIVLTIPAAHAAAFQAGRLAGFDRGLFHTHASARQLQELNFGGNNEGNEGDEGSNSAPATTSTASPPSILAVRTARELQLGISRGFQHIEIREHLDLSELEPILIAGSAGLSALLGSVPPEVWTIRGNCSTDADQQFLESVNEELATVQPRRPRMCMLLAPQDVLYHRSENLWLDNLYIRVVRNASVVESSLTMLSVSDPSFDSQLWVTNSYLQGDGGLKVNGLTVSSKAYVGGTRFMNLGYGEPPIVLRLNDSSIALDDCTFSGNNVQERLGMITYDGNATALVRISETTFETDNVGDVKLLGMNSSHWYTDGCTADSPCNMLSVVSDTDEAFIQQPTRAIEEAPVDGSFLLADDPWILNAQEETGVAATVRLQVEDTSESDGGGGGLLGLGAIVGIAAAALVPLVATAALLLWRWRVIQSSALSEAPESMMYKNPHGGPSSMTGSRHHSMRSMQSGRSIPSSSAPHLRPPPIDLMPTVPSSPHLQL